MEESERERVVSIWKAQQQKASVETKRRTFEPPRRTPSVSATKKDAASSSLNSSTFQVVQSIIGHPGISQAKNFAVAQAQQDGCKANFKVFDSPFGNFLVPVIPTRAELGGNV